MACRVKTSDQQYHETYTTVLYKSIKIDTTDSHIRKLPGYFHIRLCFESLTTTFKMKTGNKEIRVDSFTPSNSKGIYRPHNLNHLLTITLKVI